MRAGLAIARRSVLGRGAVTVNDTVIGTGVNQFEFVGVGWTHDAGPYSPTDMYAGDWSYDQTTDDHFLFDFVGSGVRWWSPLRENIGIAGVSYDGGAETNFDGYAAVFTPTAVRVEFIVPYGSHTLKVRCTGTKNPSSGGNFVIADRVDVLG